MPAHHLTPTTTIPGATHTLSLTAQNAFPFASLQMRTAEVYSYFKPSQTWQWKQGLLHYERL